VGLLCHSKGKVVEDLRGHRETSPSVSIVRLAVEKYTADGSVESRSLGYDRSGCKKGGESREPFRKTYRGSRVTLERQLLCLEGRMEESQVFHTLGDSRPAVCKMREKRKQRGLATGTRTG